MKPNVQNVKIKLILELIKIIFLTEINLVLPVKKYFKKFAKLVKISMKINKFQQNKQNAKFVQKIILNNMKNVFSVQL